MSVFRPLNSDESNLFTIRCVVTFSGNPSAMIAGGSSVTVASSLLTTPTSNNLPNYFGIFFNSNKFYVNYGKEFTSTPCVSITPRMSSEADLATGTADTDNPIPIYYWKNILKYETATYPDATNHNFVFCFKDAEDGALCAPTSSTPLNGFDLVITGPVKLGVTTGNSNKGWSVGSGNDATTAYSYMNIGVGKGNPECALDVKGGFRTTTLAYTDTKIDGVTQTGAARPTAGITIPVLNTGKLVTLDSSSGTITLKLPTPATGLNYKFVLVANSANNITITSTSDGSAAANISYGRLMINNTNVAASGVDVLTISNSAIIGDTAECICDGTNWHWNCFGSAAGAMTLA